MLAKEEVAEELNHVHQPGGKDDTEGGDEGDLLDLVVHMWRGPREPDEDEQGDDVDEELERLEQEDMGVFWLTSPSPSTASPSPTRAPPTNYFRLLSEASV